MAEADQPVKVSDQMRVWSKQDQKHGGNDPKYYYSSSLGEIVSSDGSGYVFPLPCEDDKIEKTSFVPFLFAQHKVEAVSSEAAEKREQYDDQMKKLSDFYRSAIQKTKVHYEGLIAEMKKNALKHIDVQKRIRKLEEEKLTEQLRKTEKDNDELHDTLAENNQEYQKERNSLKQRISDVEKQMQIYQEQIEELSAAEEKFTRQLEEEKLRSDELAAAAVAAADTRKGCDEVLRYILSQIEMEAARAELINLQGVKSDFASKGEELVAQFEADKQLREQEFEKTKNEIEQANAAKIAEIELKMDTIIETMKEDNTLEITALVLQQVVNQIVSDAEHGEFASALSAEKAAEMRAINQDTVDQLNRQHEENVAHLKSKFNAILKDLKHKYERAEVEVCMETMMAELLEREGVTVHALGKGMRGSGDGVEGGMNSAERSELTQRIAELEQQLKAGGAAGVLAAATEADAAAQEPSKPDPVAADADWLKELQALQREEKDCDAACQTAQSGKEQAVAAAEENAAARERVKNEIKQWTKSFMDENGRDPGPADKAAIKDKYQSYKNLSTAAKEIDAAVPAAVEGEESAQLKLTDVRNRIARHKGLQPSKQPGWGVVAAAPPQRLSSPSKSVRFASSNNSSEGSGHGVEVSEIAIQTDESALEPVARVRKEPAVTAIAIDPNLQGDAAKIAELEATHELDVRAVEDLEDELYQIRAQLETTATALEKCQKEKDLAAHQLEVMTLEKRSDVVKRFEDDIEKLREDALKTSETIAKLEAEKLKSEAHLRELKDRAEEAEKELKDRDEMEAKKLSEMDEKLALKKNIAKQRDTIVMKTKAATAGWDAAASADEERDIQIANAYKKGLSESNNQHKKDMESLNVAIETKETRITELLVQVNAMEKTVAKAEEETAEMTKRMEAMKLEVADTIASLTAVGGDGGGLLDDDGDVIPTAAELERAREDLDAAQEELVALSEKCDKLESDLELSRRKNIVYEKLARVSGLTSGKAATGSVQKTGGKSGGKIPKKDLTELIADVKKSIVKGTNFWRSNKKDECYDLYVDQCRDVASNLLTAVLHDPLEASAKNAKEQGLVNKQKGAATCRKALDKFLVDSQETANREAEEAAHEKAKNAASDAAEAQEMHNDEAAALVSELDEIGEAFVEQGYTKEENPSNSEVGDTEPRTESASLLSRAKTAEAEVKSLKKQMQAIISATAGASQAVSAAAVSGKLKPTNARGGGRVVESSRSTGGGANPAEIRKLNRKIADLEKKLREGGGGGGGGGDSKAQIANEKALNKKIKDLENQNKRDTKSLEMRATKAESALKKIEGSFNSVEAERNQLRIENGKLNNATAELSDLKEKMARFVEIEEDLKKKSQELDDLNVVFKKETALRKKYKNELEDLKGAIRVYARCRPMAKYEIEKGCKSVVRFKDETSMTVTTQRGEKDFEFDACFNMESTQDEVFEDTKRLVESCMDGFNVCLFAYGQTGSGKTFTMTGSPSMPGLTPKAIAEMYRLIGERKHMNIKVSTYFVELYNDQVVDLYWALDAKDSKFAGGDPPKLDIKMDAKKMVFIRGAIIKDAEGPEHLMELFNTGNLMRHTGATKMNAESSRSHSIFAIMVESYDRTTKRTTIGKLSLVDLAGSERQDKTGATADRLKEAMAINKSLSALGDVIACLSEGNAAHVPYRNNKLTMIMQDSLGGNAKTLMFVNFSPADYNADETSTSLMYAARVKKIVNSASKQAESAEVARLKHIIQKLQAGQRVDDIDENGNQVDNTPATAEIPQEDDGKVYDGY